MTIPEIKECLGDVSFPSTNDIWRNNDNNETGLFQWAMIVANQGSTENKLCNQYD